MNFLCKRKYRLELHWGNLTYQNNQTAILKNAHFSGPVLKDTQKIEAPDHIDLDLTKQHFTVLDSYYIIRLAWQAVEYSSDNKVKLIGATLTNSYLKSLHKLQKDDFILINTEKHEEKTHAFHLVYDSQVMRADKKPYKYEKE